MREIALLFAFFMFFLICSMTIGFGVWLIDTTYAKETAGTLIIISTLYTLVEFYRTFRGE